MTLEHKLLSGFIYDYIESSNFEKLEESYSIDQNGILIVIYCDWELDSYTIDDSPEMAAIKDMTITKIEIVENEERIEYTYKLDLEIIKEGLVNL